MTRQASRLDVFWNQPREEPSRIDPNQAAAEALGCWFDERLGRLQPTTRERIYALMVLLQRRYFYHRRKSPEAQCEPLHAAYETCYDRLEVMLEDTDPPLPEWQQGSASVAEPD